MDIAVLGAGRVGTALAVLWSRAGHRIVAVAGGHETRERAATHLPGVPVLDPAEAAEDAEVVVIATPDASIAEVCEQIARAGSI
ncbi:MAG: NAD(P)-binding domain-containing protein, partial [Actinomycetota bacterium]